MLEALVEYQTYFYIAFALLIPVLAYAIFLQLKTLKEIRTQKEKKRNEILEGQKKRQDHIRESMKIIAMATIQEQCEISEACLRLANLLPHYDEIDHQEERWKALFDMYEEIRVLKTLDERKALRAAHRHEEDKKRFASEDKFHKEILVICQSLYELTGQDQGGQ